MDDETKIIPKLYRIKETATLLRISPARLYKLMLDEKIKPLRIGGRTLFTESEIARFVNDLKKESGSA